MPQLTAFETWYGKNAPPPKIERLMAGNLEVEFQDGELRYLRRGNMELIRRVYVAVRDVNWNTIPGQISGLSIQKAANSFRITYSSYHEGGPVRFRWQAVVEGRSDGTVEFAMDGAAEADFRYNRIGFCLLHPIRGIAGRPYQAQTPSGLIHGMMPVQVEPQRIVNGFETPIFPSCTSLSVDLDNGIRMTTRFEGDLFEMEDQRNWTDGSFKTYCTPLSQGTPHQARAGQVFHQKIILQAAQSAELETPQMAALSPGIAVSIAGETGQHLPRLGFGINAAGAHTPLELERLARLHPDHLKAELHLKDVGWPGVLENALAVGRQLGCALELALFISDGPQDGFEVMKRLLKGAAVARVIVFHEAEAARGTTQAKWVRLAREQLSGVLPGVPFLGGTNGNFAQLNCARPEIASMDGISYTINPQVHAFDERSLVEGIEAQRDTAVTARGFSGDLPLCISSVTLKPPFNVVAAEEEGPVETQELPASVDCRQMSLFGAAWTAGSIRSLAEGGANSVTYYETTGWRGLMEKAEGSPLPEKFPSFPEMVYPLYAVFAFLAEAKGAALLQSNSERPLSAGVLALRKGSRAWLLVSSFEPSDQQIHISGFPAGQATWIRLNEDTFYQAAANIEAFLAPGEALRASGGVISLLLKPYETVLIAIDCFE